MENRIYEPCPVCSSENSAEIIFGFPGNVVLIQDELDKGIKILGGCDIPENPPKYLCKDCKNEWGVSEWQQIIQDAEVTRISEEKKKEEEAIARGIFEITVNENGYAKCPYCNVSFSTRYEMSWDGVMHKTCRTRLTIVDT